jgi:DNA primase
LPDGDDPDSFARKHTATEFRQYIEEHQTDFIQFKSDLLLKGVTDPIKRSEAINSIVKSISVITDPIVRASYISDCSHRLGINESTLIAQLNKFINSASSAPQSSSLNPPSSTLPPASTNPVKEKGIDTMLIQLIVRHGGEVIFDHVETEDGQVIDKLTVAQYIYYSLADDGLTFTNELYTRMMKEAVGQCETNPDFDSEAYFMRHEDVEISQLAATLCVDEFQLSEKMQPRQDVETLRAQAIRLLLGFRLNYSESKLREIQRAISLAVDDPRKLMMLMEEYKEMQQLRNQLAKKLGNNIVV